VGTSILFRRGQQPNAAARQHSREIRVPLAVKHPAAVDGHRVGRHPGDRPVRDTASERVVIDDGNLVAGSQRGFGLPSEMLIDASRAQHVRREQDQHDNHCWHLDDYLSPDF
jgi:hypothetical protein